MITSDNTAFTTIAIPISYAPTGDYEVAPYTPGDADDNGLINVNDAMAVINHIVGNTVLTGNNLLAADATGDGNVNVNDAMEIINYIVGKPEYLGK